MRTEEKFEDPTDSRIHFSSANGQMTIVVPAQRHAFVVGFLLLWLGGWTVGGFAALNQFLNPAPGSDGRAFLAFWLLAWLAGEVVVIGSLLWLMFGREIIRADMSSLSHSYQLLSFSRTRNYRPSAISNLRWDPGSDTRNSRNRRPSSVSFDYGPKTVAMARWCDPGEATFVIAAIEKAFGRKPADPTAMGRTQE